jgi:hypothetical protein
MTIDSEKLGAMLLTLMDEAYEGPADPRMTWFADNEKDSGLLGTLERLSATEASRPFRDGERASAATHAGHIRFALNLANRALRGENAHENAAWKDSWRSSAVDDDAWKALLAGLHAEYAGIREAIAQGLPWANDMNMTGLFGQLAHGAWHLGAIRQGLGLIRLPQA